MFFNSFTVGFHTNLKDLLTAKNSLRLLYNKLLTIWNMHCICFVLSPCSLMTTVSPLLVIDFIPTLKGLGTCQALSEYLLACVEFCFSWFSRESLDAYCLLCFNYLCIITWYNHNFYIASSKKQLDCMALNTYDPTIMMACAKTKARCDNSSLKSRDTGWRWNAEKYGHYMVRGGREWQWRSYSYKQLQHHQLKALKT